MTWRALIQDSRTVKYYINLHDIFVFPTLAVIEHSDRANHASLKRPIEPVNFDATPREMQLKPPNACQRAAFPLKTYHYRELEEMS